MGKILMRFQETTGERLVGSQPRKPKPLYEILTEQETATQAHSFQCVQFSRLAPRYLARSTLGDGGQEAARFEMLLEAWFTDKMEHPERIDLVKIVELLDGKRGRGRPSAREDALSLMALFEPLRSEPTED